MKRYERARKPQKGGGWLSAGMSLAGAAIARNPVAVGGTTAFFVSLAFVSANALWYQPQMHPSAFVSTRALHFATPEQEADVLPEPAPREDVRRVTTPPRSEAKAELAPETTGSVTEDAGSAYKAGGDTTVRSVQKVLGELGLYRGPVDGLTGPQTRSAVKSYQRIVGLEESGEIDSPLLRQLGLEASLVGALPPRPAPRPGQEQGEAVQTVSLNQDMPAGDRTVERVQAALRAFGNDGIEVDGVLGEDTRKAIREFQSLFGLPVTGEPDAPLLAKMREIGLTN